MPINLKERAKALKADIPAVYLCLRDKQTPISAKILAALTVAYALSPVDLIPDFVPVLGYLDDLLILPAMVAMTIRLIPQEVWLRNRQAAEGLWQSGKPKKWYYALPIVLLWAVIILWVLHIILK